MDRSAIACDGGLRTARRRSTGGYIMKKSVVGIACGAAVALSPLVGGLPAQAAGSSPAMTVAVVAPAARSVAAGATPPERKPASSNPKVNPPKISPPKSNPPKGTPPKANPPKVNLPMLRVGATGPMVSTLQKKLGSLGYWVGTPSARYDHATAQGVMALQKAAGLGRDGVVGSATWRALDRAQIPKARSTKGRVVEIDLARQLILLVKDGKVSAVINTSTGTAATPTPTGSYRVFRQIDRWHTAPLGKLYRPKYFFRGYAVHGVADGSIPGRPASHGCARVSTRAMDMLWSKDGVRVGDRVLVY